MRSAINVNICSAVRCGRLSTPSNDFSIDNFLAKIEMPASRSGVYSVGGILFINKRRNQLKLLCWEKDGLCVYHKRLEKGTFELPKSGNNQRLTLTALQLRRSNGAKAPSGSVK